MMGATVIVFEYVFSQPNGDVPFTTYVVCPVWTPNPMVYVGVVFASGVEVVEPMYQVYGPVLPLAVSTFVPPGGIASLSAFIRIFGNA
jgi:hypothetical protein